MLRCVLLIALLYSAPVAAHDYWLQPRKSFLDRGEQTQVQLFVGDHLDPESERPFQSKMTVDFRLVSAGTAVDLKRGAVENQTPIATITSKTDGGHLIVLERDWSRIELEATRFNDYLDHEGLTSILAERRKSGEHTSAGRERYRRYLKSLVQVGATSGDTFKRQIGHRLEIIPGADPLDAKTGDRLPVTVLFEGKPLVGAQVEAYNRFGENIRKQSARTGEDGRCRFTLDRSGLWVVRLVHMQRCRDEADIDWESFWAAYSFRLRSRTVRSGPNDPESSGQHGVQSPTSR